MLVAMVDCGSLRALAISLTFIGPFACSTRRIWMRIGEESPFRTSILSWGLMVRMFRRGLPAGIKGRPRGKEIGKAEPYQKTGFHPSRTPGPLNGQGLFSRSRGVYPFRIRTWRRLPI